MKKQNQDLKNWAESKKVYNQEESKREKFKNYIKETREELRKIFTEIVEEMLESKDDK